MGSAVMSSGVAPRRVPRYHAKSVLGETPSSAAAVGKVGVVQSSHDQKGLGSNATWSLGAPLKRTRPRAPLAVGDTTNHKSIVPPLPLAHRHLNSLNARPLRSTTHDDTSCPLLKQPAGHTSDQQPEDDPDEPSWTLHARDPAVRAQAAPAIDDPDRGGAVEEGEEEEDEQAQAARWAAEVARLEAETDRILAEQRARDQARRQRLELQLSAPLPPLPSPPCSLRSPKSRSPVLDKLSFLARGRRARAVGLSPTPTASPSVSPTSSLGTSVYLGRGHSSEKDPMSRNFIEVGGRGQTDAPRGASNGTDRRVTVRCKGSVLDLVVGVETSTVDILVACSNQAAQPINVTTGVVVESCTGLGLERRLRRYERIRDVLNAWDHDGQNTLIVSTDVTDAEPDLELANVPKTDKPREGFVLPLYHSHRPGKWNKRYITLLEGGQLSLSKKAKPNPSDKDTVSLCHLSDFDIYVPTESQKRKQLKPPKKYCYAIKSQQKANVFINTDNYIHYFSTEDLKVAEEFHYRVHIWRSWYMVNRVLQLQVEKKPTATAVREAEKPPQILPDKISSPKKSIGHIKVNGHKVKVSVDESPYAIGAFRPLMDLQRFDKPLDEFGKDWIPDTRKPIPPIAAAAAASEKPRSSGEHKREPVSRPERGLGAFAETSLLGAAYDERKQAQREETRHIQMSNTTSASGPFTAGPSLLNGRRTSSTTISSSATRPSLGSEPRNSPDRHEAPSWFPSAVEHTAKARTSPPPLRPSTTSSPNTNNTTTTSHRHHPPRQQQMPHRPRNGAGPPQPLLNLDPTFVEPPQWARTGRGHGIRVPDGKPLVDFATGPAAQPGARTYEVPPRSLVRRGESVRSSESIGSGNARGRRPTVGSASSGSAVDGSRSGRGYEQGYPLVSRIPGDHGNRGRTNANMSGSSQTRSPPLSFTASDRPGRARGPIGRSGTLL